MLTLIYHAFAAQNNKVQGTFLKKDDPKINALMQQAELLSSLALKVDAENMDQSLENAWKVSLLQKKTWTKVLMVSEVSLVFIFERHMGLLQKSTLVDAIKSKNERIEYMSRSSISKEFYHLVIETLMFDQKNYGS